MSNDQPKATHVAVHALQYHDGEGVLREMSPKTEFSASAMKSQLGDVAELERKGAVRRLKAAAAPTAPVAEDDKNKK
jgi:hypothetical protein